MAGQEHGGLSNHSRGMGAREDSGLMTVQAAVIRQQGMIKDNQETINRIAENVNHTLDRVSNRLLKIENIVHESDDGMRAGLSERMRQMSSRTSDIQAELGEIVPQLQDLKTELQKLRVQQEATTLSSRRVEEWMKNHSSSVESLKKDQDSHAGWKKQALTVILALVLSALFNWLVRGWSYPGPGAGG